MHLFSCKTQRWVYSRVVMKTNALEIIQNPNGTFCIYDGNTLVDDNWKRREDAEARAARYLAAQALGSARGGNKAAAARENGAKGGRPFVWHKAPARGCTNPQNELYKFTVIRNSDMAERFTDRRPRPEVIESSDYTVWNNRENCEER